MVTLALNLELAMELKPGMTDMALAMGPTSAELELALELELAVEMALAMPLEPAVEQARLLELKLDPEPELKLDCTALAPERGLELELKQELGQELEQELHM